MCCGARLDASMVGHCGSQHRQGIRLGKVLPRVIKPW